MEDPLIEEVRSLKAQALKLRDDRPEQALEVLGMAERKLRDALQELSDRRGKEEPGDYEKRVAGQLVHILGSKGGVSRRHRDHRRSIGFYDEGYELEQNQYHMVDSYTLVQRLIARVLENPGVVDEASMKTGLREAGAVVQKQIDDRLRDRDEYASADLAVLRLLLAEGDWEARLGQLAKQGSSYAVNVTHDTLKEIEAAVKASPQPHPRLRKNLRTALRVLPRRQ